MKKSKYKVLVLSDLKLPAESQLKSAISLAKIIDADIKLLHIKKPTEIVKSDSQLSAMRTISKEHIVTSRKIEDLLKSFNKEYGTNIAYKLSFGNLKDQISTYLKEYKPDIVVLGTKRKSTFSILGDRIANFVLKKHNGPIMITGSEPIDPNSDKVSLGVINEVDKAANLDLAELLFSKIEQPIKSFNIIKSDKSSSASKNVSINEEKDRYVVEGGNKVMKSIEKYALESNVNLMFANKNDVSLKGINKLNVSILLSSKQV